MCMGSRNILPKILKEILIKVLTNFYFVINNPTYHPKSTSNNDKVRKNINIVLVSIFEIIQIVPKIVFEKSKNVPKIVFTKSFKVIITWSII